MLRLLSNPQAYEIVSVLGSRGRQTTEELSQALPDVPQSTLYRLLARLRDAGMVAVAEERKVRGTVERTYGIASRDAAALKAQDLGAMPIGQLREAIRNFVASMAADIAAFIESRAFSRARTETRIGLVTADLTDEEYAKVFENMRRAIRDANNGSKEQSGRRRRRFYIVALPGETE